LTERVLVTGTSGQDGSYLCERLLAEGCEVHGLTHGLPQPGTLAPGRGLSEADQERIIWHSGDLVDPVQVGDLVAEIAPSAIYNLAGISSVAQSWEMPRITALVTGVGAITLFEAALKLQERTSTPVRVVQASSAEIFGSPSEVPQTERTPISPVSPYGAAKAFAHHMAGAFRSRGLHVATVILYNHESPRRPPAFVTRKITSTVAAIAVGKAERLSLGNLDARRDWGWAPDYVDAMVRAARHDVPGDYIVATGESHSVREFVAAAFERAGIMDWQERVEVDPAFVRPVDPAEQLGDSSLARRELGWRPTVDFAEIVGRMVDADLAEHMAVSQER